MEIEMVSNKMKKISLFIIIGILILPTFYINIDNVVAASNTYYVSNNGSDSNNGLSTSTPWKTIGKVNTKMNDGTIKTGDDIYFKRGDTFTDAALNIKVGGTSADRMIIGDYSTGNKPIFSQAAGNDIIDCGTTNVNYVTIQNIALQGGGDALQIWNSHDDIIITGVTITSCSHNAMYFDSIIGLIIENCIVTNSGYGGIELYGSQSHRLSNVIVRNTVITNTQFPVADAIEIHNTDDANEYNVGSNFLIENCTGSGYGRAGFDVVSGENIVYRNCSAYGNTEACLTIGWYAKNVTVINCFFHDQTTSNACGITMDTTNQVIIRDSRFYNIRYHDIVVADSVAVSNINIFNNDIVYSSGSSNTMLDIKQSGTTDVVFKNNIIMSLETSMPSLFVRYIDGATIVNTQSNFSHNIWYRGDNSSSTLWNNGITNLNWVNWGAQIQSYDEKKQDPLITPGSDLASYVLPSNSPCVDSGDFLTLTNGAGSGTNIVVLDASYFYDGYGLTAGDTIIVGSNEPVIVTEVNYQTKTLTLNTPITWNNEDHVSMRYLGTGPDIGAYEFNSGQSDNTPPEITQINSITSNPLDTNPLFGWVNLSCMVTDNTAVNTVQLLIKNPSDSWNNVTMNLRNINTYYYRSSNAFSQTGNYTYIIKATDANGNVKLSASYPFLMPPNWDINKDRKCNILDLVLISNVYNTYGSNGWIREDVDNNGEIKVLDLNAVSNVYGDYW
jgi:hypothetical protein